MKKKLIVVADDFGFSEAYNYGVIKAYKEGIVTALSLMSNMAAAPHAVQLWRSECPEASLVQHTNFVQYRPVSKPEDVPSLVDENGMFYRSYRWRSEQKDDPKCKGDIYPTYEDFYTETMAQLERHKELTGRYPNHFEGHSAMTKPMDKAFADVGEKMGIHNMAMYDKPYPGIRQTFELLLQGPAREKGAMEILNRGSLPEDFFEDRFCLLDSPHEINILHFHPGYLDQYLLDNTSLTLPRCRDLQTLCDPSVRRWLEEHEIELVDFNAVYE
ncbi:ChbG/HpnK family deacetylase [uncultured Gemmiger sp.]|uniref:ChbG/HpnK family deacetylase n=1 Tax=uncultured Gemmiger sp. TaxID=1623490 RepID=UPI0025DDC846|nr:ChbG/HpnK family deacetylase [uncultured Gemmiger sp.]